MDQKQTRLDLNMFITCEKCPHPYSCTDFQTCVRHMPDKEKKELDLHAMVLEYEAALRLIATPERPDGTFNRDRKAVQFLAEQTLKKFNKL